MPALEGNMALGGLVAGAAASLVLASSPSNTIQVVASAPERTASSAIGLDRLPWTQDIVNGNVAVRGFASATARVLPSAAQELFQVGPVATRDTHARPFDPTLIFSWNAVPNFSTVVGSNAVLAPRTERSNLQLSNAARSNAAASPLSIRVDGATGVADTDESANMPTPGTLALFALGLAVVVTVARWSGPGLPARLG